MTSTPESRLSVCLFLLLAVGCAVNTVLEVQINEPTTPLDQAAKPLDSAVVASSDHVTDGLNGQSIISCSKAVSGEDDASEQQSKLMATQRPSDSRSAKKQPSYSESLATEADAREAPTL